MKGIQADHPARSVVREEKLTISRTVLTLLWLISVAGAMAALFISSNWVKIAVGLSGFVFIIAFILALSRESPASTDLPDLNFMLTPKINYFIATTVLLVAIGMAFIIGLVVGTAVSVIAISALIGLGLTLRWRALLTRQIVLTGLAASLIVGAGIRFLGEGDLSWAIFNMITVVPLFTGGALLVSRTGFGKVRVLRGEYSLALKSFLWAGVLAVPAALLNLLGNLQQGDTWVVHWWQPVYAIVPGVAEEIWARLFLTTFCYALLRPASNQRPRRAMVLAVLVGALVHSFAHTGIDPLGLVIGGLLYFVPTALLFIKRDLEQAIGYHFVIDFVRFSAALLQ